MKNKLFLISILIVVSLIFLSGCFPKKNESSETGATTTVQDASAESSENVEDDIEEDDFTTDYVEDYTVVLKEDESFEIN